MGYARSKSWDQDQKRFNDFIAYKLVDALPFMASIRNSVAKQEYWKSRPKVLSKSLIGAPIGYVSVSHDARKAAAYAESNRALLHSKEVLTIGDLNLSWSDESLCNWAENKASICSKLKDKEHAYFYIAEIVESYGLVMPEGDLFGDECAILRTCDVKWWRRQVRVLQARTMDQLARHFRMVHAKAQTYCSNQLVHLRRSQARRNRSVLEGFEAVNQDGDTYTLAELSDLSVSNPTNRRHELMVRIAGFEKLADQFNHVGLFITMSAPSRFHPMRQFKNHKGKLVRVDANKVYGSLGMPEYTPRDSQAFLVKTWALIRADFARSGIRCYGFRVVEPHHDGCPHWHFLLFFSANCLRDVESIFKRYASRLDGFEPGADKRVKIVRIDKNKGSAAGYIAKYICKSIDGSHIESDLFGNTGVTAAERICAWASGWGIRQFQQIGGASVTVWRELRRLKPDTINGVVEQAREAADASDWAAYCLLQGQGFPFFGRDDQLIRPDYTVDLECDADTGELIGVARNKYGEPSQGKLCGIRLMVMEVKHYLTRIYQWTIQRVGTAAKVLEKALPVTNLSADELLDLLRGDGSGSANRAAIALDLCQ